MKRAILISFVTCLAFTNLSFMGMSMTQANAQSSVISTIWSIITSIFSSSSSDTSNNKPYKEAQEYGKQDCSDELIYYYNTYVKNDGTIGYTYVGFSKKRYGQVVQAPPTQYDVDRRQPGGCVSREGYARIECDGAETTTPCTNRAVPCDEQFK